MEKDLDYEKNNIGINEQYPNGGIKCKNYMICNTILPNWWYECVGGFNYLCSNCERIFGIHLCVIDKIECPICITETKGVRLLNCDHSLCIHCFKRCYYGSPINNYPIFPYPEIEEEYWNESPCNTNKWNDYPLIQIYLEEWDECDELIQEQYRNEEYLRKCPLCRN